MNGRFFNISDKRGRFEGVGESLTVAIFVGLTLSWWAFMIYVTYLTNTGV